MRIIAGMPLVLLSLLATNAAGQWLKFQTPGIPRHLDGTPNLAAPAPRLPNGQPDFQGLWVTARTAVMPPNDVIQPWARAVLQTRQENLFRDRPNFRCRPSGPEVNLEWKRIIQTPSTIAVLNESQSYRVVFLDGRALEPDPARMWMGYSVGRWDGDALVVESFGYNDQTWLNPVGLPHTEALRVTERYTRPSYGQIKVEMTIVDPGAFTKPWTASATMDLRVDTEMLETVCEGSSERWLGSLADVRATAQRVDTEVLARYVGEYSGLWGTARRTVRVRLEGGVLRVNGTLGEDVELIAQSDRVFAASNGLEYEFIGPATSPATQVVERHVSGDYPFARQR